MAVMPVSAINSAIACLILATESTHPLVISARSVGWSGRLARAALQALCAKLSNVDLASCQVA
jgi:hypothetical protein